MFQILMFHLILTAQFCEVGALIICVALEETEAKSFNKLPKVTQLGPALCSLLT